MTETSILANKIAVHAHEAKNYARRYILKGATQLENNALSDEQAFALDKGVDDVRSIAEHYYRFPDPLSLENHNVYYFNKSNELAKKYGLGNCDELSLLALDYFLTQYDGDDISAEMYEIHNGDHQFLVIGRKKNSDPHNPLDWGDQAVICDPWLNMVYKASDYLTYLKSYRYDRINKKNCVDDFKFNHHRLDPVKKFNAKSIRRKMNCDVLIDNSLKKLDALYATLEGIENKLKHMHRNAVAEGKALILVQLLKVSTASADIQLAINEINQHRERYELDYASAKQQLDTFVSNAYVQTSHAIKFSQEKPSFISSLHSLFKFESPAVVQMKKSIQDEINKQGEITLRNLPTLLRHA